MKYLQNQKKYQNEYAHNSSTDKYCVVSLSRLSVFVFITDKSVIVFPSYDKNDRESDSFDCLLMHAFMSGNVSSSFSSNIGYVRLVGL